VTFPELLAIAAYEQDADVALDKLTRAALELTSSRNALLARANDELGCLELSHGVGKEWGDKAPENLKVEVSTNQGIVGYVGATGSSFKTGNVRHEPKYRQIFASTISEMAIPVRDRHGRIRAVLNVESDKENAYDDEAEQLCQNIALLMANVVDRQEALTREEALIQISNALDNAWNEEDLIEGIIRVASDVLRFQAFSVFLLDPKTEMFVLRGSVGVLKDQIGQIKYKRGDGCTGWVAETGLPMLLNNPAEDPRWRGRHVEFPSEQIASFLAVPILARRTPIGVIRAIRRVTENPFLDTRFTESDQRVLMAVGEHMASVLSSIQALERMMQSERMAAWGELSARSSHMIGNRMFALRGDVNELGYILEADEISHEALKETFEHLKIGVHRIEEILQDFRDFLTATSVRKELADVNALVKETADEMRPHRSALTLTVNLSPELPEMEIDERRLRRAVSELIENAFNHVETGGVEVATRMATLEDIRAAGLPKGRSYATIDVSDSGPGVDPELKKNIFQPFFSSRVKGMGLGLSIVKGIVDAHGGGIYEGGQHGEGAKFVILLPLLERSKTGNK
jgi:signal transduction histidine kinase